MSEESHSLSNPLTSQPTWCHRIPSVRVKLKDPLSSTLFRCGPAICCALLNKCSHFVYRVLMVWSISVVNGECYGINKFQVPAVRCGSLNNNNYQKNVPVVFLLSSDHHHHAVNHCSLAGWSQLLRKSSQLSCFTCGTSPNKELGKRASENGKARDLSSVRAALQRSSETKAVDGVN